MLVYYPKKMSEAKLISRDISVIVSWFGFVFLIPMLVAIIYGESNWPIYLAFTAFVSGMAYLVKRKFKKAQTPFTHLTIVTLAATWVTCCVLGALPFIFIGEMSILDGFFESVSSISTAGLTTIQGIENIPHSVLFWRAVLAWLGGIGITSIAFYGIMQSESISKIVMGEGYSRLKPNLINSAKEIFKIYSFWTITGIALLVLIGVPVFDSFNLSMNAISTTGVDVHSDGWSYYQRTMPENFEFMSAIVGLLMIMGAISFVAHYRVIKNRKIRLYLQDTETRVYILILIIGLSLVSLYMVANNQDPFLMAYEALSTSTTGGFEIEPYATQTASTFVMSMLIFLALMGGSSNSAAGGLKIRRIYLMLRYVFWRAGQQISPQGTISHFKYDGKPVKPEEISDTATFIVIYLTAIIFITIFMVAFGYEGVDSLLTVASAQSGGGVSPIPGWELAAPVKVALIGTMLFGRLEFIPMLALFLYAIRRK